MATLWMLEVGTMFLLCFCVSERKCPEPHQCCSGVFLLVVG